MTQEKLVSNPLAEIHKILQFLGLSAELYNWDTIDTKGLASNSSYNELSGKGQVDNVGITGASIGNYARMLSRDQIHTLDALFQPYLMKYGYESSFAGKMSKTMVRNLLELFARYYPKYRYSQKPLMARLLRDHTERYLGALKRDISGPPTGKYPVDDEIMVLKKRVKSLAEGNSVLSARVQRMQARNVALQKKVAAVTTKKQTVVHQKEALRKENEALLQRSSELQKDV